MVAEKRLIDANEAYEIARDSGCHNDFARSMADLASLREVLEECTTVDAVEVVHGRWEWRHTNEYTEILTCSVCSKTEGADERHNYCPNCGAKMDGDGNG